MVLVYYYINLLLFFLLYLNYLLIFYLLLYIYITNLILIYFFIYNYVLCTMYYVLQSYSLHEYVEALIITFGVAMFTYSERSGSSSPADKESGVDTSWGIFLVFLYLLCDSFTSQWQSRVRRV